MPAVQDEEKTPIKQDIKKGKLRFYPYNINWCGGWFTPTSGSLLRLARSMPAESDA